MLTLFHSLTLFHHQFGQVNEGAVEACAVVDNDDAALKAKPSARQNDHPVCRRNQRRAGARCNVNAGVIRSRLTRIDALASEKA